MKFTLSVMCLLCVVALAAAGAVLPPNRQCTYWCRKGSSLKYDCCDKLSTTPGPPHPGSCPIIRGSCPPHRIVGGAAPNGCRSDRECPRHQKCCYDSCLRHSTCKPVFQ